MLEDRKERIDLIRRRFDEEVAARSPSARKTAEEYLAALGAYLDEFDSGPASDTAVAAIDTTGALNRTGEYAAWVEEERRRVRRAVQEIA